MKKCVNYNFYNNVPEIFQNKNDWILNANAKKKKIIIK